jgi:hypothetical protein
MKGSSEGEFHTNIGIVRLDTPMMASCHGARRGVNRWHFFFLKKSEASISNAMMSNVVRDK